jgi:CelD/BcsL family acetyltransferase involved in cellulose biosynthesis
MTVAGASVLRDLGEIERLVPAWARLCDQDPRCTPFQEPGWALHWCRRLGRDLRPLVLAAHVGDELIGVAPLTINPQGTVRLMGAGIADYLGFVLLPGSERPALETIYRALEDHREQWQSVVLEELRHDSPLLLWDRGEKHEACVCPVLNLPGSMRQLRGDLPLKLRKNLRRARQMVLGGAWDGAFTACHATGEWKPALEALFELHQARWRQAGEEGQLGDPALRAFHRDAAAALRNRGQLRIYALRQGSRFSAVLYGFALHRRFFSYFSGFDPQDARLSPGALVLEYAIEQAIEEGCREFDFLRGTESYKYVWGAGNHQSFRLTLSPPSASPTSARSPLSPQQRYVTSPPLWK